jgi:hypothetical protein
VQTLRVEGVCRPWADRRRAIRCEVLEVRSPECYRDPILNLMRFHPGGREAKAGSSAAGWCGVGPSLFTTGYSKWLRLQIACKLVMIHACIFQHTEYQERIACNLDMIRLDAREFLISAALGKV